MSNILLFDLINASRVTPHWQVAAALVIAQWIIWIVPVGLTLGWIRGDDAVRLSLLEMVVAVLIALAIGQVVTHVWPQPRPFMLHLGSQYLAHDPDPGMPSDHVTVFWSLACAACGGKRLRPWAPVLFALGLLVGWSRVFLGVHFPFDVLGALPVAAIGAAVAYALRSRLLPVYRWLAKLWERLRAHLAVQ